MLKQLILLIKGGGAKNITTMTLNVLANEGELTPHQIRDWFMSFGADGALVLEGKRNNVTNKACIV